MTFCKFRRGICIFCLLALLVGLAGCAAPRVTEPTASTEATRPPLDPNSEEALYERLFDIHNRVDVKLHMAESEIAKLQADYDEYEDRDHKSPIYRMADLEITITTPDGTTETHTVEQVGVRMKGTVYSRTGFYSEERGVFNMIHFKISFQETFDNADRYGADALHWVDAARKARKNRTFATLKKIDLKWNRSDDSTFIRDNYSSMLYQSFGILSPRGNLSNVDWNDLHMGLYTLTETVDEVFLARYLPQSALGGDLYKCAYLTKFNGEDTIGVENEEKGEFYLMDLKTNKKKSDHSSMHRLLSVLNDGIPTKEEFAEVVDVDYWLMFNAVAYFLGDPDDMRDDYNNVYVYFRADNGKAIFIPHDFDRGLGVTYGNGGNNSMTSDNPFSLSIAFTGEPQVNPLYLYSVCIGGYFIAEYIECMKQVAPSPLLEIENFNAYYAIAEGYYKKDAQPGKQFDNIKNKNLSFDLNRTTPLEEKPNVSFADYITAKQENFLEYLADADYYIHTPMKYDTGLYLLSKLNEWMPKARYQLGLVEPGVYGIYTSIGENQHFRLLNQADAKEYGYADISPENTVPCKGDADGNIILEPGSYVICFHTDSKTVSFLRVSA